MADAWLGISSANYDSDCGSTAAHTLSEALDGTDYWGHYTTEAHWFIIDLGAVYTLKSFRSRSLLTADPTDVDIFISTDKATWGAAVASGITTWQDSDAWVEIDSTDKDGRYIKVVVNDTESVNDWIAWGASTPFTILDAYGDVAGAPAGWANNLSGVANAAIGKVNGVAIASI